MKPFLPNAQVYKRATEQPKNQTPEQDRFEAAFRRVMSLRIGGPPLINRYADGSYEFEIGARFKILELERSEGFKCYKTDGDSSILSLYNMVGGYHNLNAFNLPGSFISDDYYSLPDSRILSLPRNYSEAIRVIDENYIGKTFRVVAKSPKGSSTINNGCFYLFAIDD